MMADGESYKLARERHADAPDERWIRGVFGDLRARGIMYFRDGGDRLGVSRLAKAIAPEYGIEYRTPEFILHREGHYGAMYGRSFGDLRGARELVREAGRGGADFVKIAVSGMLDFEGDGGVTGPSLELAELCELVNIASGEGFRVMAHCNGARNIKNALEAGVASLEHGFSIDDEGVALLRETGAVWVPTCVTVANNLSGGRYPKATMERILAGHAEMLRRAASRGCLIATGSDSGAYGVPHGSGTEDEIAYLGALGIDTAPGNERIRETFRRD